MRIAALQMCSAPTPEPNLAALDALVGDAVADGAQYVLSPEVTVAFAENREGLSKVAAPYDANPALIAVSEMARRHGVWLHLGSLAVALEDGRFANRSVLFSPRGDIVAHYDKIHLFDADLPGVAAYRESATYRGGEQAVTAQLGDVTLGFSICYDVRFAALFGALARAGASLIAVPAAFTVPTGEAHWEVLLRARAIETGSYIIAAAQGGRHANGRSTYGHSMIVDPWGKIIACQNHDREGVVLATLDPEAVLAARARVPALANARPFELPVAAEGSRP
ncbi:carbon-nitrogen hydrolase family protein [Arsenicitalea aurantiaca]|uniref:Carbon-nitrogen hydrolase family protein n=1 Tax=Arsenicitalea aurantiaca TaxID=1783274 RepID=A0A433X5V0_9HYPH|nr:carbon-nitrogen hydrolase family protein [Arsenicitalea aurantiaca]RUT29460.1 carbon-nitrogen hydrolase family protein [Arsenicitalea aurantiaca]